MRSFYREVLRCLLERVQWLLDPSVKVKVAGKSGISQARSRLGREPVKQLYDTVVTQIAEKRTKGAWYRQWRPVSLDGSSLDIADKIENDEAFGGSVAKSTMGSGKVKVQPITPSNPFKWRHFPGEVILLCVRWYLR